MKNFYFRAYTLLAFSYLFWRIGWTLNLDALIFSIVFLLCEFHDVWNTNIIFKNLALYVKKKPDLIIDESFQPSLDVFITTYDESPDLVEITIDAACNLDYPCKVYVLDDGKREELKALCENKNVTYLTRKDNSNAKAGNLNNALKHSTGEYILTLDADIIPFPEIVNKTMSYFKDSKLALMQMPQEFYNPNAFSHNPVSSKKLSHWNDQTLFFYFIQPGKNVSNSSFWCGSPAILRRSAFESIGGVKTETITEDIQTTIRLHSEGWKTVFHKEILALGLAPDTLEGFLIQRYRWACGTFQLLHTAENPLTIKGLTLRQRIEYLWTILFYVSPITKVFIYFSAFLSYFIGELPMKSDLYNIIIPFIAFTILNTILVKINLRDAVKIWRIEILRFCLLPVYIKAMHALFVKKRMPFIVTPKEPDQFERERTKVLLRPHIYIVTGAVFFLILGTLDFLDYVSLTSLSKKDLLIALAWMIPGTLIPIVTLRSVINRKPTEREHRFERVIPATLKLNEENLRFETINLSFMGMGLSGRDANKLQTEKTYQFVLESELGNLNVEGKAVWLSKPGDKLGIRLNWSNLNDKKKYLSYCYGYLPKEQLNTLEFPRVI